MAKVYPLGIPFRAQFRVAALQEHRRPGELESDVTALLDNYEGRCTGLIPAESSVEIWNLAPGQVVFVKGKRRFVGDEDVADVESMYPLSADLVENGAAVLPLQDCPTIAHAALERLVSLNHTLDPPVLRDFLSRVLLDPAIGVPFMRSRAAARYHHAYPGGLLVHSTEMLDLAATMGRAVEPRSPHTVGIVQLGYLLHDLGKIDTVGEFGKSALANPVRHEAQTLILLGSHLGWLAAKWPEGARWLTAILKHCALPRKERPYDDWMGSQAVVFLDRLSVARDCSTSRQRPVVPEPSGPIDWENINEF
jgi:hypothetical protein